MSQLSETHIQDQIKELADRMDAVERKLDLILSKLDSNCDKMGRHIDFIDGVYASVKVPFNYISNKMHKIAKPFGKHAETHEFQTHSEN